MADDEKLKDVQLLKSTRISVFVDEALQDMLVVTYEFGVKIYKGVLLDYSKRNLPHGITNLHPAFNAANTKPNPDDDVLYSVNQRFAYMDPNLSKPKNIRIPSKYKNNKMTVRLRPRQVLCSKCKGICNENSENVSKKRKSIENNQPSPAKRSANAPITRSVYSEQLSKKKVNEQKMQPTLIPKLSRLLPQEISNALNGKLENLNNQSSEKAKKEATSKVINVEIVEDGIKKDETVDKIDKEDHSIPHSDTSNLLSQVDTTVPNIPSTITQDIDLNVKSVKRTLRKKRSIGSMEDLWDESVFEEGVNLRNAELAANNNSNLVTDHMHNNSNTSISTRTIKISYGPQGEGTVLKIPAPIEKFNTSDDSEENINVTNHNVGKGVNNKSVRKALKRAKKKARQKRLLSGNSPSRINALSPRYTIGGGSPRYTIVGASPRHCLGSNSPRYVTSSTELHIPKRHKHKLKRKKRHRDDKDRKHKEEDGNTTQEESAKEQAVSQKLSINLKRLHSTTYASSCQNLSDKVEENTSSSDEHGEHAPDFPASNSSIILRVNAQTLSSALGADGGKLMVGDVVWGKIHGFPWWPGKVLTITTSVNQGPQAHVSWYGSSTSSLIQCDQLSPYLDNFKIRYNKKKRGAYKEAIRKATTDARQNAEIRLRKDTGIVSSPSQSIMTVPPPTLASPREIDVMS